MSEMTKRNYTDELAKIARAFNKPIVADLKNSIEGICKYYQLTKNDLCQLCEIDENILNALMTEDCDNDCLYDLRTISLLTLLSNGNIHTLSDTPDGKMLNEVNRIIKDYQDEKNPPRKPAYGWDERIMDMLELFGVKNLDDMDHLLNAVKSVRNAINEYDLSDVNHKCTDECCKKEKSNDCKCNNNAQKEPVYVDVKGNFHSQKPYTSTNNENKITGKYFDSTTMDKPKEFEFTGNFDKIFPNIMNFITKKLF